MGSSTFWMLRIVGWKLVTEVSGQIIGHIFKNQAGPQRLITYLSWVKY
jgi:hypothetical protein